MNLLILGGTRFVGRHLVDAASARGHTLTLFHRGQSPWASPPGVRVLHGDRRGDLSALTQGRWDAVIDTCGYLPGEVEASASLLAGRVGAYAFVSSISAYAGFARANDEDAALARLPDGAPTDTVTPEFYGALKAACEQRVQQHFGAQALVLRPGLIVGPLDPTRRFAYWPARLARCRDGEPVLAPGRPDDPVQGIDARDLAAFTIAQLGAGHGGVFNLVTSAGAWTRGALLEACAGAAGVRPQWRWIDDAALLAAGVAPWTGLPLWLPASGEHAMFMQVDGRRAAAAGLSARPLAATVADTLAWWRTLPPADQGFEPNGLTAAREAALLAAA